MSISLQGIAQTVASELGDKGAIVISYGREGVRVGTEGLTMDELRQALCVAINYSYVMEEEV